MGSSQKSLHTHGDQSSKYEERGMRCLRTRGVVQRTADTQFIFHFRLRILLVMLRACAHFARIFIILSSIAHILCTPCVCRFLHKALEKSAAEDGGEAPNKSKENNIHRQNDVARNTHKT